MNLTGIISISGKPGLYKVVAQAKNNIIVESLEDKKRIPAYSSDKISALEDISIYTYDEDVSLKEIFKVIYDKVGGKECISHKEDKSKLENYLLEILPNYDQERVYISDVKKIFQWFNLLQRSGELKFEEEKPVKEKAAAKKKDSEEKSDSKETQEKKAVKKETKTPAKKAPATKVAKKTGLAPKKVVTKAAPKKATVTKTGAGRGK